jgi:DNA-directed RNA polymerase specialized sigma24 family protein
MVNAQLGSVVRHIRQALVLDQGAGRSDADLIAAFTARHDQAAFAVLVERQGALVMGVCRHVLQQEHDAEDAFQATFLVLAANAGRIRKRESLGSWLYGVAYRVAMRAKRQSVHR